MMIVIIVLLALLVSLLRLLMPLLNHYQVSLLQAIARTTQTKISAVKLEGRWEPAGPVLNMSNLSVELNDGSRLQVKQINLALNIWQSILHSKLQFKNLLFRQLTYQTPHSLSGKGEGNQHLQNIFLHSFDHFRLEDSELQFVSLSGKPVSLAIPSLTWYNDKNRHKAEGEISLSSFTGQHGSASLRLSLYDTKGKLENGEVWLQARQVDVRPWIGHWLSDNTSLKQAQFTLTSWIRLSQGQVSSGDMILTEGTASWQNSSESHSLNVQRIRAHLQQQDTGWQLSLPEMQLKIDDKAWPTSQLAFYWQPETNSIFPPARQGQIRVRANHLNIQRFAAIIPLFTRLPLQWDKAWREAKPQGILDELALDIPLAEPKSSRIRARWHNLSFRAWRQLPALTALGGEAEGTLQQGEARVVLPTQQINTNGQFVEPLHLKHFTANLGWFYQQQRWQLQGKQLDLTARSLRAQGEFLLRGGKNVAPYLSIQANMQTDNGAELWRYFPLKVMPPSVVDYLRNAIRGGSTDKARLTFNGNPHEFPFAKQQGNFNVTLPLKNTRFAFLPTWPELKEFDVFLHFNNDALSIRSPKLTLINGVQANDIEVDIPHYSQQQLFVKAKVQGQGAAVASYFQQTPLKKTVGDALQQLVLSGPVASDLQLRIPLDGEAVKASGDVFLADNQLNIKPLQTQLTGVTGRFHFLNATLSSSRMTAYWLGQPIAMNFATNNSQRVFAIDVALKTRIRTAKLKQIPADWTTLVSGSIPLNARIAIKLLQKSKFSYSAKLTGDLNEVRGFLPASLFDSKQTNRQVKFVVDGDQQQFKVKGQLGDDNQFITRWLVSEKVQLEKGQWQAKQKTPLSMPVQNGVRVNLSASQAQNLLNGWQLIKNSVSNGSIKQKKDRSLNNFPLPFTLSTPALVFAGQTWRNVKVSLLNNSLQHPHFSLNADEIKGDVNITDHSDGVLKLAYFYYNPQQVNALASSVKQKNADSATVLTSVDLSVLPNLTFQCQQCWFYGQNFGEVRAKLQTEKQRLIVTDGEINDGASQLNFSGDWNNVIGQQRTSIKGRFHADKLERSTQRFGFTSPLYATGVNLTYDLHWQSSPWQPDIRSLSGTLKLDSGKGRIVHVSTGHTGQVLRLFSIDALLRKIKMDFEDTVNSGFYFDKIAATAWIDKGVLRTNNLQIDGLEADIALKGNVDLLHRKLNLEALITPEIAAPAGVATAFALSPVAGAAVYFASKILSPWWSRISLLHYSIKGPINKPLIEEMTNKLKPEQP